MRFDYVSWFLVCLGTGALIGLSIGPRIRSDWYPRVLRRWGSRRAVRVEFVLDGRLRLREGSHVETALGGLYVRLLRVLFAGCGAFGLSYLLLAQGPHLSTSTANSWAVAGLPMAATVYALFQLKGFTDCYRTSAGGSRVAGAEDYVWPVVRALTWLVAAASLVIPVAFAVLAAGPSYDAQKLFWEGIVGHPVAGVLVVVLTERWLRRVEDVAEPDDPTLYVWDCLRTRAVQLLYGFALVNLWLGFETARSGLSGVAQLGPEPDWLPQASALCWLLQLAGWCGFVLVLVQPVAPRLRARLWPGLTADEPIEFGRALPIS